MQTISCPKCGTALVDGGCAVSEVRDHEFTALPRPGWPRGEARRRPWPSELGLDAAELAKDLAVKDA